MPKTDAERAKAYVLRIMNVGDARKVSDPVVDKILTNLNTQIVDACWKALEPLTEIINKEKSKLNTPSYARKQRTRK